MYSLAPAPAPAPPARSYNDALVSDGMSEEGDDADKTAGVMESCSPSFVLTRAEVGSEEEGCCHLAAAVIKFAVEISDRGKVVHVRGFDNKETNSERRPQRCCEEGGRARRWSSIGDNRAPVND